MSFTTTSEAPVVSLGSGLMVANFGSPHQFDFEDGSTLERCSQERVEAVSLRNGDTEVTGTLPNGKSVTIISKRFILTNTIVRELTALQDDVNVDVILVPFPLLDALRQAGELENYSKVATVYSVDRQTKKVSTSKFCR